MPLTRKFSEFVAQNVTSVVGLTTGANSIGPNGGGGGSGAVTQVITQVNTFTVGQWVRFDVAMNLYVLAQATTPLDAEVIGVVIDTAPPGGPPFTQFTLQQSGYITMAQNVFMGLIAGEPYYLDDAVAGNMVNNDVLIDGEVSRPVFVPDSATSGWVLPYRGIIAGGGVDTGGGGTTPAIDSSIITVTQNLHGLNVGDWVRVTTPQVGPQVHYILALADTLANSQAVGVVIEVINPNSFRLQFSGYVATDGATNTTAPFQDSAFAVLVPSTIYYLSSTVAGAITSTDPGLTTGYSKPLFVSEQTVGTVNRNAGWILPQRPLSHGTLNNPSIQTITQAAHGFTMIGTIVKPSTILPGVYVASIATSLVPSFGTAMIIDIPDINTIVLQEVGYVTGLNVAPGVPGGIANTASPFAIGQPYYLSTSAVPVSGQITTIEPTSPNYSKPCFIPDQVGSGWILPMKPTIANAGGGGLTLIARQDMTGLSNSTFNPNVFNGTFRDVMVVGENLRAVDIATGTVFSVSGLKWQVYSGGILRGTTYWGRSRTGFTNLTIGDGLGIPSEQWSSYGNATAASALNFTINMNGITDVTTTKEFNVLSSYFNTGSPPNGAVNEMRTQDYAGYYYGDLLAITGVRFELMNVGLYQFVNGTISLYGVAT